MNNNENPMYSVIIPTYNEASKEEDMRNHLVSIREYFQKIGKSFEIVIALDGPTDGTDQLVRKNSGDIPQARVLDRKENRGKGYTIREGFMQAKGEFRLWTDMDGATPINTLDKMIPKFEAGADIVIGSRDLGNSKVKIHQPKWKEMMGDLGNILIQAGAGLWGIEDTQCGFKAFRKKAVEDIFPRATVDRWGIDFELLMLGKKRGYKIEQVPVEWFDRGASLVGIKGYFLTFRDLFKVRLNMMLGVYQIGKEVNDPNFKSHI
jgi:dolichyl-phosphate beta-glucosyltransferase